MNDAKLYGNVRNAQPATLLTILLRSWYHQSAKISLELGLSHKKEKIISTIEFRVNENIRVSEVRLIGPKVKNIGVVSIKQVLQIARDAESDGLASTLPSME